MYETILFPTDGSEGAEAVEEYVFDLAADHGAAVHVLYVADTTHDSVTRIGGEVVDALVQNGKEVVAATAERAADRGIDHATAVMQGGVAETIVDYASEYGADAIVMPTHGRKGVKRYLLGSVTEKVVRTATVPVLTLSPGTDPSDHHPIRRVLVPSDGSRCAEAALDAAIEIAGASGAALDVIAVVDTRSLGVDVHSAVQAANLEDQATQILTDARETAESAGIESVRTEVEHGSSISGTIREYAEDTDVDLVVMGTHGRTGIDRYLLGSVTERVVRSGPAPVLTVPIPD